MRLATSARAQRWPAGRREAVVEKAGGRFTEKTDFVAAGGQVKSMLAWLEYMKHGEPQERILGLQMPAPTS